MCEQLLKSCICIIPSSECSDKIIHKYNLQESSVGGIQFYTSNRIILLVINFADVSAVIHFLSYFMGIRRRIILIKPQRSRYGVSSEIFDKIKKMIINYEIIELLSSDLEL